MILKSNPIVLNLSTRQTVKRIIIDDIIFDEGEYRHNPRIGMTLRNYAELEREADFDDSKQEDLRQKLEIYQKEMREFGEFLKNKFMEPPVPK